jgi:hypothetical protein
MGLVYPFFLSWVFYSNGATTWHLHCLIKIDMMCFWWKNFKSTCIIIIFCWKFLRSYQTHCLELQFFEKNCMWFSFVKILQDVFVLLRDILPQEIIWFLGFKTCVVFWKCNLIKSLCVDDSDMCWYWMMTKSKQNVCLCIVILRYLHVLWGFFEITVI